MEFQADLHSVRMEQRSSKLASYNCRGFKSSEDDVSQLFRDVDILALQEHWLHSKEFGVLSSVAEDVHYYSVSPMEENQILPGRPFGGVVLVWHSRLQRVIYPVKSVSDRSVSVRIQTGRGTVLIIAIYMPVDYGTRDSIENYIAELYYFEGILESEEYDEVVFWGDLNADLRSKKGRFTSILEGFLLRCSFNVVGLSHNAEICRQYYTWDNEDFCQKSWIDYICVSQSLKAAVDEFDVLEDGSYVSEHYPVTVSLNISVETLDQEKGAKRAAKRLMWQEAKEVDLAEYCQCLELELDTIQLPAEAAVCNDPGLCHHREHIQVYYDRLVSANRNIPRRKRSQARKIGWDNELKQLKTAASCKI